MKILLISSISEMVTYDLQDMYWDRQIIFQIFPARGLGVLTFQRYKWSAISLLIFLSFFSYAHREWADTAVAVPVGASVR